VDHPENPTGPVDRRLGVILNFALLEEKRLTIAGLLEMLGQNPDRALEIFKRLEREGEGFPPEPANYYLLGMIKGWLMAHAGHGRYSFELPDEIASSKLTEWLGEKRVHGRPWKSTT
jgi:hypothetical protein